MMPVHGGFLFSADSHIVLRYCAKEKPVVIPAQTEVIGRGAFCNSGPVNVLFETGTKVREIDEMAFSVCSNHSLCRHPLRQSVIDALRVARK
jgi:hypothetical protein